MNVLLNQLYAANSRLGCRVAFESVFMAAVADRRR